MVGVGGVGGVAGIVWRAKVSHTPLLDRRHRRIDDQLSSISRIARPIKGAEAINIRRARSDISISEIGYPGRDRRNLGINPIRSRLSFNREASFVARVILPANRNL